MSTYVMLVEGDLFRVTSNNNLFYRDNTSKRMKTAPLEVGELGIVLQNKTFEDSSILLHVFIKGMRGMIIKDWRLEKL